MKRNSWGTIITFITILAALPAFSQSDNSLYLRGRVRDAVTKDDLINAKIIRYDVNGNATDTITANGRTYRNGEMIENASFWMQVERKDSVYTFDVTYPGYKTETVVFPVTNVGKREENREIPVIFLDRAAKKLDNVTVTASKVKFYNRGDTLVFNADAFQLAEGSMLDALIAQLPGVEIKDGGQIYVNGEFVETLLLNGKDFFKGDNQIMLDNIGAYTVKNVEVYKGQTDKEKWENDPTVEKHLTMNVKLKKEYSMGWIINAQAAGGTKDRYLGRLFASWFTPTTNITILGNANNLNDNRQPGKNDSWTPEMLPTGTRTYKMASMNYDYQSPDENRKFNGYVKFEGNSNNSLTTTNRTNFFASGDTYDNSFSRRKNNDIKLETRNYGSLRNPRWYWWHMVLARYMKSDNKSSSISASFNREQTDITAKVLEAIYSDGSPELLDAVINRSISKSETGSQNWEVQFYPDFQVRIPGTNDRLQFQLGVKYQDRRDEEWHDYNINYGADPKPAELRRQYFDNSPIRTLTLDGTTSYYATFRSLRIGLSYSYRFLSRDRNSSMYALDQLADMGIFGTLPTGYQSTFDPTNSYTSRTIENKHELSPSIGWSKTSKKYNAFISFAPVFSIIHQNLDYKRNNLAYPVKRTSFLASSGRYNLSARVDLAPKYENRRMMSEHSLQYNLKFDTKTPNLMHLIDIVDDNNPLNISLGNPDLKSAFTMSHDLSWRFSPRGKHLNNNLRLSYETTYDALVRGYTYNTSTGVRHNRTYNVDGNNSFSASNYFNIQFGTKEQFTFSSSTTERIMRYADMIGVNQEEPTKSSVNSNLFTQGLSIAWQIGKQQLRLSGSGTHRHTSSSREDFRTINANHFQYGIIGNFRLPAGFGINTDFMLYTRDGYGSKELDTTDMIWNMQLSYTPKGGHWVLMLDSFDILHQLSNVNYAVNASGRTVSYTNALPRYVMLSAQYRLNLQPKKRK